MKASYFAPGILLIILSAFASGSFTPADDQMVRIAKITIDPARLTEFKAVLKESMETAVGKEPGVLSYHAVSDKKNPTKITILEVYANVEAYESHIQTPHFQKYKSATSDMVKSLELVDVDVIGFVTKE